MDVVEKIVIDEVHTIFSEMSFREKYKVYAELPSLGIPIVVLSGSMPIFAIPKFAKRLGLSGTANLSDVKTIVGSHVFGKFCLSYADLNLPTRALKQRIDKKSQQEDHTR